MALLPFSGLQESFTDLTPAVSTETWLPHSGLGSTRNAQKVRRKHLVAVPYVLAKMNAKMNEFLVDYRTLHGG